MGHRHLLAAAAACLVLSGCSPKYKEAPALSKYFAELTPNAPAAKVRTVSFCMARANNGEVDWFTTVSFTDRVLYHYRLNLSEDGEPTEKPVSLEYYNTHHMRSDHAPSGCEEYTYDYGFKVNEGMKGYVHVNVATSTPFNDRVKLQLKQAARAVEAAIEKHKSFVRAEVVPVEQTWGIKP